MNRMVKKFMVVLLSAFMFLGAVTTPVQAKGDNYYPTSIFDWIRWWQQPQPEEPTEPAPEETPAETEKPAEETKEEVAETERPAEEAKEETPAADETVEVTEPAPEEAPAADEMQSEADAEETPAVEDVSYPAVILESGDELEGIAVTVDAPEEALPEGVTMSVKKVDLDAVQAAVNNTADLNGKVVAAVDITFYDADGNVFEPLKEINVTITSAEIPDPENAQVVHVDTTADEIEAAEVVEIEAEPVEAELSENTASFDAEHFSIYAIVDGSTDEGGYRATYIFQNADGTPYYFKDKAGEEVDNQILKDREILEDVGVPSVDVSHQVFNGWYYWTEESGYGEKVTFGAVSVTGNDTIYVRAHAGEVHYVTFYEDAEGTLILNRIQVAHGTTFDISSVPVDSPESELAFVGWNESAGTNDDSRTAITNTSITVDADKKYYPVFKKAHWITFETAPVGSGATYIAPAFVLSGSTAANAKPADPTWRGHDFEGWSTTEDDDYLTSGSFTPFNFNQQLNNDVKLYAQWKAARTNYTVVFWQQLVTDSKSATNAQKNYEVADVKNYSANAGSTVTVDSCGSLQSFTGFTYNSAVSTEKNNGASVTVDFSGNTIVNVYYDRNLITMRFYSNGTNAPSNGYNWNGWTTNTQYVTTYTGLYGQTLAQNGYEWPAKTGNTSNAWIYYTNGSQNSYMSFLGQFVLPDDVKMENEIRLYRAAQPNQTFEFYLQDNYSLNENQRTYPESPNETGSGYNNGTFKLSEKFDGYEVVGYRRYYNNRWYDNSMIPAKSGDSADIKIYNYYLGLAVYYARKPYVISYRDSTDSTELDGFDAQTLAYEQAMLPYYPSSDSTPTSKYPGKVFNGRWYADSACTTQVFFKAKITDTLTSDEQDKLKYYIDEDGRKVYSTEKATNSDEYVIYADMPNHNVTIYAGWEDVWYWIKVDPNGGQLADGQSTWFWETYGETVTEYTNVTRNYVEDADGTYYYHYDEFNNSDPNGTQPSTRLAYYTTDASKSTDNKKYRDEDRAYALIGWYDITNGQDNAKPYNFGTEITGNLILQAKWRRVGEYSVRYETSGYIKDLDGKLTPDQTVVGSNGPSDSNKYADQSDSSILSSLNAPEGYVFVGWYLKEQTKNPGDVFVIHAEDADENKVIHIYPIFQKYESQPIPVTHIDFYANYNDLAGLPIGNVTAQTEGVYSYTDIQINKGYDIISVATAIAKGTAAATEYDGYTFLGWSKKRDAKAEDVYLKWVDDHFEAKSGNEWVKVTQVGADENTPYENLYAVWQGTFKVYHSGAVNGNIETIAYTGKTYDLTATPAGLTNNTLYGGYYLEGGFTAPAAVDGKVAAYDGDNWTWTKAETTSALSITPKCGETYYIKEVPSSKFLQPYTHYTYYMASNNIANLWMISDIDDLQYQETGFIVKAGEDVAKVCQTLTVTNKVGGASVKLAPNTIFKKKKVTSKDYLTYAAEDKIITALNAGELVVIDFYWVTMDGLRVTGTAQRTLSGAANKDTMSRTDSTISSTITVHNEANQ